MPQREDHGHAWIGATTLAIPLALVRQTFRRGTFVIRQDQKVRIEEVYCLHCRVTYERARDRPCAAAESREHLIGGPVGDQRRRRPPEAEAAPLLRRVAE